jgi:hypothetical protein
MSPLERRCRMLLRAYPRWYRRQRGDEMLATLLEASAPGQKWPSARDARALIMGGLRVRTAQNRRLTMGANLGLAAQLGVALTLLLFAAGNLTTVYLVWIHLYALSGGTVQWSVFGLLGLAAVVAAWFAPRRVVVVLALAAAAAAVWLNWDGDKVMAILPAGLLVSLAVLVRRGERLPRSWLLLAGPFFAFSVLQALTIVEPFNFLNNPLLVVLWILLGLIACWMFVDARPALALAICIACTFVVSSLLDYTQYGYAVLPALLVPAGGAAVLAAGSIWRLRRQAVL